MSEHGDYVRRRQRGDGSWRYYQTFDTRWRPKDFPRTVELFVQDHAGQPTDEERALIKARASEVYQALVAMRRAGGVPAIRWLPVIDNDWKRLGDQLENGSLWWDDLAEASRKEMRCWFRQIATSFGGDGRFTPGNVKKSDIELWLRTRGLCWSSVIKYQGAFNRLLEQAVAEGLRESHTTLYFRVKKRKRKPARLWDESDVEALCAVAEAENEQGLADLIRLGFDTGQRLCDLRQLRYGYDYEDGELYYLTNKTDASIMVPLRDITRSRLDSRYRKGELLFPTQKGRAYTNNSLGRHFRLFANSLPAYASPPSERYSPDRISLRHLRHTAVVKFAVENVGIPKIASVTGHSIPSVYKIMELYCPRHPMLARRAMEARFGAENVTPNRHKAFGEDARIYVGDLATPQKPTAAWALTSALK